MCNNKEMIIMKTIDKKTYVTPQMELVLIQNQQSLLAGSNYTAGVNGRDDNGGDGYDIGD